MLGHSAFSIGWWFFYGNALELDGENLSSHLNEASYNARRERQMAVYPLPMTPTRQITIARRTNFQWFVTNAVTSASHHAPYPLLTLIFTARVHWFGSSVPLKKFC
jgi:hypothetical protein